MDLLLQLECWLKDEQDHRVFWLNGLAGTGKSTIAQTFAEISFADGDLGASFFCSRDFEARSSLHMIFPTLAFQLAYWHPQFRERLLQVLRANPDIGQETLYSQMEKIIVDPLKVTNVQTLIIIDALDECKDNEPASTILSVLSRYVDEIRQVKFFITGRPEPRIRTGFRLDSLRPITEVLKLHDVERSLVDSDIKLFLKTQLANALNNRSDCNLTVDWPGSSEIDILCKKAAGLFIYASIVVKFVTSMYHPPPTERLTLLISLPRSTTHEGKLEIDPLYTQILEQAFHEVDSDKERFCSNFRSVVGTVLLVFNPLPLGALSTLLGSSTISTTLRPLHSVILCPNESDSKPMRVFHKLFQNEPEPEPIRAFHKSFPDFLMDPERCKDKRFLINPSTHHWEILLSCLNLMKQKLKRNICSLDDCVTLSEVGGISEHRKKHIGDALGYACRFWAKHLMGVPTSGDNVEKVHEVINGFFKTQLLFWIEALIIMGNLDAAVYAINDIQQWYISVSCRCFIC